MPSPLSAWRAGIRWPLALLAALTVLVVAIAVCEAIGWPFLVTPVRDWLAGTSDRRVLFDRRGDDGLAVVALTRMQLKTG